MELSVVPSTPSSTRRGIPLQEPIYRRQEHETDKEYQLFLIYRDLPWDQRSLKRVSAIATENPNIRHPHTAVIDAKNKWSWEKRVDAFELFIQEIQSDKQERAVLELKAEVEVLALRLVRKIANIEAIENPLDLSDPKIQRDLAVIEAIIGKGNAGKFVLDAYKTVIGEKLQIGSKKIEDLVWKAVA